MVIDRIQREVLAEWGHIPGDYTLFAEQAENLFMPPSLFALDEYGIPIQTAQALKSVLTPADTLNEVLKRFRDLPLENLQLTAFEHEVIAEVRETLFPSLQISRGDPA